MLSSVDVILWWAWSAQALKGVFQPKAITAAMITISTISRIMSEIARNTGGDQWNSLQRYIVKRILR